MLMHDCMAQSEVCFIQTAEREMDSNIGGGEVGPNNRYCANRLRLLSRIITRHRVLIRCIILGLSLMLVAFSLTFLIMLQLQKKVKENEGIEGEMVSNETITQLDLDVNNTKEAASPSDGQIQAQQDLKSMAQGLQVTWSVVTNTKQALRYQAEVTLQNLAPSVTLDNGTWQIHLNSISMIEPDLMGNGGGKTIELPAERIKVTHVQGSHFYIEPMWEFISLPPGRKRMIKLKVNYWSVARTDAMPNWYMTSPNLKPELITSTQGESLAFVTTRLNPGTWKRYDFDYFNPYSAQERYSRNYVALASDASEPRVIPKPLQVTLEKQNGRPIWMALDTTWTITYAVGLQKEAQHLKEQLKLTQEPSPPPRSGPKVIELHIGQVGLPVSSGATANSGDAYSIRSDATEQRVIITGKSSSGVFYGIVTLLSLRDELLGVPVGTVLDGPRFEYRGLMLDIARNFHGKEAIIKLLALMSSYKLNRLHLHLTDDEGWRIEIPALPELTQLGAQRCHDPTETRCLQPDIGSGPDSAATSLGSGYLTSNDYTDILTRAQNLHIRVIPEIDMPGHARAAIKAMELRKTKYAQSGNAALGRQTMLVEEGDTSIYTTPQMYTDNAINPCLESTYTFVEKVLDELILLHRDIQPMTTFHFGGDEVGRGAWVNSTTCQAMKAANTLPLDSPKAYFFQRMSKLAKSKGLSLGAWEDGVMEKGNEPYNISTTDNPEMYAYSWDNVWEWGTTARTYKLANKGYKVVMAHGSHLYFDHPYEPDPEERGYYWATRFTDTKKTFSYNAKDVYANIKDMRSGQLVKEDEKCGDDVMEACPPLVDPQNIAGLEGTLFSETTRTDDQMDDRFFPRVLALAERAWHEAPWENVTTDEGHDQMLQDDWFSFARAVGHRELRRLENAGVSYRIPPPGAVISHGRLLSTPLFPVLWVEYSLDAGRTWMVATPAVDLKHYKSRVWLRTMSLSGTRVSRTVVMNQDPPVSIVNQPVIDYIAQNVSIHFTLDDNFKTYGNDYYKATITWTNIGNETVAAGNWEVFFVSVQWIEPDLLKEGLRYVNHDSHVYFDHVKGYLFKMGPTKSFPGLEAYAELKIDFRASSWTVSRYEQMPRWYVSAPGMNARDIVNTVDEHLSFVSPFNTPDKWKREATDLYDPWTPAARYDRNYDHLKGGSSPPPFLPTPMYHTTLPGTVQLKSTPWVVAYEDSSFKPAANFFKESLELFLPEVSLSIAYATPSSPVAENTIRLVKGVATLNTNSSEAYSLQVDPAKNKIFIFGTNAKAVFNGVVSLLHLSLRSDPVGELHGCNVTDWPRFEYRGMHIDVARNFMPKAVVLQLIDAMALYKLNTLHLHLTDDEGWRLEIPGLEELTQVSSQRCHDLGEVQCVMSTLGSGANDSNSGSGYYSVDGYKEILLHASQRHIRVIPEFDLPGHAHAAIVAMRVRRQRLLDLGYSQQKANEFMLVEDNDPSQYWSVQLYDDNAINPCIESTYNFIGEIVKQVKIMHSEIQTLSVFHFGGDEVAKGAWKQSKACVSLIQSGVNLKQEFTRRVSQLTSDVTLAAWEDGLMDSDGLPWNRTLLGNTRVITQAWDNVWEWGVGKRAYGLANAGYKVVLSPVTHAYFDQPQEPSPEERGFYWGTRFTDVHKTFSFMPDDYYGNIDVTRLGQPITKEDVCKEDMSGCPPLEKPENVIGMQGQLWSETVRLPDQFWYMVFPRLLALAERAWHKGSWEGKPRQERLKGLAVDWSKFAASLGSKDLRLLDKLGVEYRVPPPGARQSEAHIKTNVEFPGLEVQYRTERSWALLTSSNLFQTGQTVYLRTVSTDRKRSSREVKIVMKPFPIKSNSSSKLNHALALFIVVIVLSSFIPRF